MFRNEWVEVAKYSTHIICYSRAQGKGLYRRKCLFFMNVQFYSVVYNLQMCDRLILTLYSKYQVLLLLNRPNAQLRADSATYISELPISWGGIRISDNEARILLANGWRAPQVSLRKGINSSLLSSYLD